MKTKIFASGINEEDGFLHFSQKDIYKPYSKHSTSLINKTNITPKMKN